MLAEAQVFVIFLQVAEIYQCPFYSRLQQPLDYVCMFRSRLSPAEERIASLTLDCYSPFHQVQRRVSWRRPNPVRPCRRTTYYPSHHLDNSKFENKFTIFTYFLLVLLRI
jgi:hypothetical protein